jgi:hypothetical protein
MSLTQGEALPDVETLKEVETTGPSWYTDYLENLATAGTKFLGVPDPVTGEVPEQELVAGLTEAQKSMLEGAATGLTGYTTPLGGAETGLDRLTNIDLYGDYMTGLMDKYEEDVINEMARQQQQDLQRYLLPSLKGGFVGAGGLGSQRYAGALGQMGGDIAANLYGQQAKLRQQGFQDVMDAALKQAEIERGASSDLASLAAIESQAAERGYKTYSDLLELERGIEQQKLLAPLAASKQAADIFANLKVPSTVTEEFKGPMPGAYSTSPLSQIAGLGTLFASGAGGTSAIEGLGDVFSDVIGGVRKFFPDTGTTNNQLSSDQQLDYRTGYDIV